MVKALALWWFALALLGAAVLTMIKLLGWISWRWLIVLGAPFAVAAAFMLAFLILYGFITLFVWCVMR